MFDIVFITQMQGSSFDRMYGTGAYKLAIEVYLNPDARNQWMSGNHSVKGILLRRE